MANMIDLYAQAYKTNPYEKRASAISGAINSQPNDRFGYSSIAKIPQMYMLGAELGKAEQFDDEKTKAMVGLAQKQGEQQQEAEAKKEKAKNWLETFKIVMEKNPKAAVPMFNDPTHGAKEYLGYEGPPLENIANNPNSMELHFNGGNPIIWSKMDGRLYKPDPNSQDGVSLMTEDDIKKLGTPKETQENRSLAAGLQAETAGQSLNNVADIYTGAGKAGTENIQRIYGKGDKPASPTEQMAQIKLDIFKKVLANKPVSDSELTIIGFDKDPYLGQAVQLEMNNISSFNLPIEQRVSNIQNLADKLRQGTIDRRQPPPESREEELANRAQQLYKPPQKQEQTSAQEISVSDILNAGGKVKRDPKTGIDYIFDTKGNLIGTVKK